MIATAAYIFQAGYHAAHDEEYEQSASSIVDLAIYMAFDLMMVTAISAPEFWIEWVTGL